MAALLTLTIISLIAANESSAATWQLGCKAGAEYVITDATTGRGAGHTVCAVPTSASDDTQIIDTRGCDNADVALYADSNGDGTGAGALQWTLQTCPVLQGDSVVNTDAERDASCVAIGTTTTGSGVIHGSGKPGMGMRINFGGTFAGDPVVFLSCNGT